jgi:hypothetical protein
MLRKGCLKWEYSIKTHFKEIGSVEVWIWFICLKTGGSSVPQTAMGGHQLVSNSVTSLTEYQKHLWHAYKEFKLFKSNTES